MIGGVIFADAGFIEAFHIAIVDFRYITHHVRQFGAIRIFPLLIGVDGHPVKTILIDRKTGDLSVVQPAFQRHRFIAAVVVHIVAKGGDVLWRQIDNRRQRL
ncbi:hypothetical protein D3C81_567130 [compost metagenome]